MTNLISGENENSEFLVNTLTGGSQQAPWVTSLANGDFAQETVAIKLTGVNDTPEAEAIDAGAVSEDAESIKIDLLQNATDVDNGAELSVQNVVITTSDGRDVDFLIDDNGVISVNPDQFQDLAGPTVAATALYFNDGDVDDETGVNGDADLGNGVFNGTAPNGAAALELDGTSYDGPAIDLTEPFGGAFTISMYGRFDDLSASGWQRMFDLGNGQDLDELALLNVGSSPVIQLAYHWGGTGGNWNRLIIPNQIVEGEWAHWTVTITEDGIAKVFKDGVVIGEKGGFNIPSVPRDKLYVGNSNFDSEKQLTGAVSTFQLLDYALSDQEVAELYANGGITKNPPETVDLVVTYDVVDEHGASTSNTAELTVKGANDAPVVEAALTGHVTEGNLATFDLLAGASDVDNGDVLSIHLSDDTLPAGISFNAETHELTVDASHADYQHLGNGESQEIEINYTIEDSYGATVDQSITLTIDGVDSVGLTIRGTHRRDELIGTEYDDNIRALRGDDIVDAQGGDDYVHVGYGSDLVWAGQGDDTVFGGRGEDKIHGGDGDDRLWGGNDNDMLFGEQGDDILTGGEGADVFVFSDNSGDDTIRDFSSAEGDKIDLSQSSVTLAEGLYIRASAVDDDVVLTVGNSTIVVENTELAEFSADWFIF